MATGLSFDIGYASKPNALAVGIDVTAGGKVDFTSGTMPDDALTPAPLAASDTTIVAKVTNAEDLVPGAELVFQIAYKVPA